MVLNKVLVGQSVTISVLGGSGIPQLLMVPINTQPNHLKRSHCSAFPPTMSLAPSRRRCSTARAGMHIIRVGVGAMH